LRGKPVFKEDSSDASEAPLMENSGALDRGFDRMANSPLGVNSLDKELFPVLIGKVLEEIEDIRFQGEASFNVHR
jgi:hypothetical protein